MDPLWAGLGVVTIGAAIGRIWLLPHGLPNLATSDEVAVVTRTNMVMHGHLPTTYDWPSGSMVLLAGLLRVLGFVDHSFVVGGSHAQFLAARLVSAVAGVALCPITGLVAYQLTIHRGREVARVAAWSAALVVAVAYTAFRMSGYAHPEIEQALFATLSVLSTVCYVRHRLPALAVAAGALAGLAAATKYIGGFALIPLLVAVLFCGGSLRRRLATGIAAIAAAAVVFVALVPAVFFRWSEFLDGVKGQFSHQADGHLGYDSSNPALGFHVTQSLPGSLGWPLTVVLLIGAVIGLVGGRATTRVAALFVVLELAVLGSSHVLFPHYILVLLPTLVAVGLSVLWQAMPHRSMMRLAVFVLVVAAIVPTAGRRPPYCHLPRR